MTFRFPDMVPDPDPDLDPAADEYAEWILGWYLAEDRALRAFETGEIEDDDPDEHGCLTDAKWDEEDDPETFDENDDLVIDESSGGVGGRPFAYTSPRRRAERYRQDFRPTGSSRHLRSLRCSRRPALP